MSDLNKYGTAADVNKYIAELEAQLAAAREQSDLISQEMLEKCAHEAEIWDSEPLSGKSIAQQIRALSAADIRAKWERKTQDAARWVWCVDHQRFPTLTRPFNVSVKPNWTCASADGMLQHEGNTANEAVDAARGKK